MKMRVFTAVVMLIMSSGVYYMMHKRREKMDEIIREVETGKITYRENEVETAMKEAEELFAEAGKELESGELMASYRAYHKGRGQVSVYVNQHGDQLVAESKTMAQWYDEKVNPYLKGMAAAYPALLEKLGKGQVDPDIVKNLANYFDHDGFPQLKEMYEEKLPGIKAERIRHAPSWFRLHVYGGEKDFLEVARVKISERLNPVSGIQLVTGYALSPEERKATWKSLSVSVNVENARYQFDGKNRNAYQFAQPNIPKSVKVEFKLEGMKEILTNWDKLKPLTAEIDVPSSILLEKGSAGEAEANQIARKHKQDLLEALSITIDEMPELLLFPDIDIETAAMVKDGALDRQVVMAIAFADRERVLEDLTQLSKEGVESSHGDVAWLAVVLGMEELSGFVTDKLPELENSAKTQVLRELGKRPYYGDFEPLLAAINRVPERQYPPSQAMQALGKHLEEEKVKKAFFDKVKDPSSPGRENYLHALVRSMDQEELENLSPGWIADSDDNFSQMAFSQVKSYDKRMALSLMEQHFNDVSPAVRQIMLRGFDFSEEKHSAKVREILEKSASQNEDKKLKISALEVLGKAGYVSEIWNFLNTYVKSESDDRRREHIKNNLIYNLRRAHPDEADEMLLDWLDDETGQIRFSAAMALLGQNDDKKAKLQALADKLKGDVDDELVRGVVQAAYQYWKLRKGWDAEHLYEPLQEILKLGLNSPDEKVRERAKEVVSRAVAAGDARYGELIN